MNRKQHARLFLDSGVIVLALGVPGAIFSNAISDALSSREPDWLYVAFCGVVVVAAVLARLAVGQHQALRAATTAAAGSATETPPAGIVVRQPLERVSLGDLVAEARQELCFYGVSAKRSVTEDSFHRSLKRHDGTPPKLRFLLLDPQSPAFERRAKDEREPTKAWRSDLEVTVSRLRGYKESLGVDAELRLSSRYPIWRAIIVDREKVYVSVFLPGRRGTESTQYEFATSESEIALGLLKDFEISWEEAREVRL